MFCRSAALALGTLLITSLAPPPSIGVAEQVVSPSCKGQIVSPRGMRATLRASEPNDTLCFRSGTYRGEIVVKPGQTFVADKTVLKGNGRGTGITVKRGGSARGFEVRRFATGIKTVAHTTIVNNHIHHNKLTGINAYGKGIEIRRNVIAYNNLKGDPDSLKGCWGRAGAYIVNTRRLALTNNKAHHNGCDGFHFDVGSRWAKVVGNRTARNSRFGIFIETSCDGNLKRNTVRRNRGGGIGISTSLRVRVHHNRLGDNANKIGILIWDQKKHKGPSDCNPKHRSGGHRVFKNQMNGDRTIRRK